MSKYTPPWSWIKENGAKNAQRRVKSSLGEFYCEISDLSVIYASSAITLLRKSIGIAQIAASATRI